MKTPVLCLASFASAFLATDALCLPALAQPPAAGTAEAGGNPPKGADSQPNLRTWTDSTGKYKVEAEFVGITDGKVQLKKADGRTVSVPIERLSEGDQDYVRAGQRGQVSPSGKSREASSSQPGTKSEKPDAPAEASPRKTDEVVAKKNPDYVAWCSFKPGSMRNEELRKGVSDEVTKIVKVLKSVTDSTVVIERTS